jgi:hypothetical protein
MPSGWEHRSGQSAFTPARGLHRCDTARNRQGTPWVRTPITLSDCGWSVASVRDPLLGAGVWGKLGACLGLPGWVFCARSRPWAARQYPAEFTSYALTGSDGDKAPRTIIPVPVKQTP